MTTVEIREITPPRDVQDAMNRQLSAERTRRAVITESEGTRQATINVAEGDKQSNILRAEGDRQAAILRAEGFSQALERIYGAATGVDEKTMALQYLEALKALGASPSTKYIIPLEFTQLIEPFAGYVGKVDERAGRLGAPGARRRRSTRPRRTRAATARTRRSAARPPAPCRTRRRGSTAASRPRRDGVARRRASPPARSAAVAPGSSIWGSGGSAARGKRGRYDRRSVTSVLAARTAGRTPRPDHAGGGRDRGSVAGPAQRPRSREHAGEDARRRRQHPGVVTSRGGTREPPGRLREAQEHPDFVVVPRASTKYGPTVGSISTVGMAKAVHAVDPLDVLVVDLHEPDERRRGRRTGRRQQDEANTVEPVAKPVACATSARATDGARQRTERNIAGRLKDSL